MYRLISLILIFKYVHCDVMSKASDVGFPDNESVDIDRNGTRVPLFIPGRCPTNQLLYPGDQNSDWICDCRPGYIYSPRSDGCFPVFRQGPCPIAQYLVLLDNNPTPVCAPNPCTIDGKVMHNGTCYQLNKSGEPCAPVEEAGGIFGVNATTLELGCLIGIDRLSLFKVPQNILCQKGSKRYMTNRCRIKLSN